MFGMCDMEFCYKFYELLNVVMKLVLYVRCKRLRLSLYLSSNKLDCIVYF